MLESVGDDVAVLEGDDAGAVLGDVHLVGDEDDGNAAFLLELLEDVHDLDGGSGVEVAGWLVGKQDGGRVEQGASDGDALLLAS